LYGATFVAVASTFSFDLRIVRAPAAADASAGRCDLGGDGTAIPDKAGGVIVGDVSLTWRKAR
jgi:hypothetical protein